MIVLATKIFFRRSKVFLIYFHYYNFWSNEKLTFNLMIVLLISWKKQVLISWNSISLMFPNSEVLCGRLFYKPGTLGCWKFCRQLIPIQLPIQWVNVSVSIRYLIASEVGVSIPIESVNHRLAENVYRMVRTFPMLADNGRCINVSRGNQR
jgi:hypothetical protein